MPPTFQDILLFTGGVYGLAWLVCRSKLLAPLRARLLPVPFLGPLVHCIVCTSAWVAMGMALILPFSSVFSTGFRVRGPADLGILIGWTLTTTWVLGRYMGDAD